MRRPPLLFLVLAACSKGTPEDVPPPKAPAPRAADAGPERLVDVPTTLAAVRARASATVAADVRTINIDWDTTSDGANCGHAGAACALIYLLPKGKGTTTYQYATLTEQKKLVYEATFSAAGEFQDARVVDGDGKRVRYVELVNAARLKRQLIVVTREAAVAAGGQEGEARRVSLLAQVDLKPAYLAALVDDQRHAPHKGALAEAMARREVKARVTLDEMYRVLGPDDFAKFTDELATSPYLTESLKDALREIIAARKR